MSRNRDMSQYENRIAHVDADGNCTIKQLRETIEETLYYPTIENVRSKYYVGWNTRHEVITSRDKTTVSILMSDGTWRVISENYSDNASTDCLLPESSEDANTGSDEDSDAR
jgi:hypothetical protein